MVAKHSSIQVHENILGFQYQIFETWYKNSTQFFQTNSVIKISYIADGTLHGGMIVNT